MRKFAILLLLLCPVFGHAQTRQNIGVVNGARNPRQFQWSQKPAGSLTGGVQATITLAPCPQGLYGNDTNLWFYISGTGTPEAVISDHTGSCAPGAASGTVVFTPVNTHGVGFVVGSASSGIYESLRDVTPVNGSDAHIVFPPSNPPTTVYYSIYAPVTSLGEEVDFDGNGALIDCEAKRACFVAPNGGAVHIHGFRISTLAQYTNQVVTQTACAANVSTISTTLNPTVGSYVDVQQTFNNHYWGIHLVATSSGSSWTYADTNCGGVGSVTAQTTTGGNGYEFAFAESSAGVGMQLDHLSLSSPGTFQGHTLNNFAVVLNDQNFHISDVQLISDLSGCTTAYCANFVYAPGAFSPNAAVIYADHLGASMYCAGNGFTLYNGNTVHISDTVIQGFSEWSVMTGTVRGGFGPSTFTNVYNEVGGCTNPLYPGSGLAQRAEAGIISVGGRLSVRGGEAPIGQLPQFAATGNQLTQYNYWLIARDTGGNGYGPSVPLYCGQALVDSVTPSGSITVACPRIGGYVPPAADVITYDLLRTTGAGNSVTTPNGSNCPGGSTTACGSVLTAQSQCATAVCSFTDNAASSTTPYVVPTATYYPYIPFWPGGLVLLTAPDTTNVITAQSAQATVEDLSFITNISPIIAELTNVPMVYTHRCSVSTPGVWVSCLAGNSNGNTTPQVTGTLIQNGDSNAGQNANLKGRLNFLSVSVNTGDVITISDSQPKKTIASPFYRPAFDAADTAICLDQGSVSLSATQLCFRAPIAISNYIGVVPDNVSYLERLTATLKTFTVPLSLKEGGASSGVANFDKIWANSGTHRLQFNPNAAGTLSFVGIASPGASGNCAKLAANGYDILDSGATCGGSTPWNSLQVPSGSLSLAMGSNTSLFTFGATTGANDLFKLTDTASNTGTGNLFRVSAANGSGASPVQFDANGNGIQMNTSGVVVPKGTGGISGTAVNSDVVAPANGGTGAASLAYGAALANGTGAWTSLAPGANNNCMLSNGSVWLSTACPGAAGSAVVTNPANSATNNIQTLADAVPLSVSGQTAQTNDIVAFYGQVAMSVPSAPVLSQIAGGALGSSAYYAKTTCVDNLGRETTVSAESAQFTVSISNFLVVTGPTTANAPLGCQGWRPYITLAGGAAASETLQTVTGSQCTLATNVGASNYCAVNAAWTQTVATTSGSAVPGSNLAKVKNFWIGADGSFNITGSLPSAPVTVFFPGNLTSTWVGAKWTPYNNITITRIQAQAKTAPVTCTPNATVRITDGTNVQTLAINAASNDSGVISQNYSSGVPLSVDISTAAAGCGTSPADVNVVLEVKLH